MPDLAGAAGESAQHHSVDDDPRADSGADRDDEEVLVIPPDAVEALGDREGVDIVLDKYGQLELAPQRRTERNLVPSQLGGFDDPAPLVVDRPGHPDSDPEERGVAAARDEAAKQCCEIRQDRRC